MSRNASVPSQKPIVAAVGGDRPAGAGRGLPGACLAARGRRLGGGDSASRSLPRGGRAGVVGRGFVQQRRSGDQLARAAQAFCPARFSTRLAREERSVRVKRSEAGAARPLEAPPRRRSVAHKHCPWVPAAAADPTPLGQHRVHAGQSAVSYSGSSAAARPARRANVRAKGGDEGAARGCHSPARGRGPASAHTAPQPCLPQPRRRTSAGRGAGALQTATAAPLPGGARPAGQAGRLCWRSWGERAAGRCRRCRHSQHCRQRRDAAAVLLRDSGGPRHLITRSGTPVSACCVHTSP
jgi:hypothetical protein